jgi:hypothetical protein
LADYLNDWEECLLSGAGRDGRGDEAAPGIGSKRRGIEGSSRKALGGDSEAKAAGSGGGVC